MKMEKQLGAMDILVSPELAQLWAAPNVEERLDVLQRQMSLRHWTKRTLGLVIVDLCGEDLIAVQ